MQQINKKQTIETNVLNMDTKDIMVICVIFKLGHLGSCRIEKEIIECGDDR